MRSDGFSLLEATIALAILTVALAGMVPTFQSFMDGNSLSEERSNAVAAAQEVMETLRQIDPGALPSSGSSPIQPIQVGQHEYEVLARFCQSDVYCNPTTRHIVVEVSFAGKKIYTLETVYTRLR